MRQEKHVEKLSFTIDEFAESSGFSRRRIYVAIASGELKTFKHGKRRMVSADAAREFIAACERKTAEAEGR
jgi:helix-turn-helix protein